MHGLCKSHGRLVLRIKAAGYVDWQQARKYVYEDTAAVARTPTLPSRSQAAFALQGARSEEPAATARQVAGPAEPEASAGKDACPAESQPSPSLVSLCSVSQPFFTGIEYVVVSVGWKMVCDWDYSLYFDESRVF